MANLHQNIFILFVELNGKNSNIFIYKNGFSLSQKIGTVGTYNIFGKEIGILIH